MESQNPVIFTDILFMPHTTSQKYESASILYIITESDTINKSLYNEVVDLLSYTEQCWWDRANKKRIVNLIFFWKKISKTDFDSEILFFKKKDLFDWERIWYTSNIYFGA